MYGLGAADVMRGRQVNKDKRERLAYERPSIVTANPIVEERRVRRQAGDLGESEA